MWTEFTANKPIQIAHLFDGRLEEYGIEELITNLPQPNLFRFLTDGENPIMVAEHPKTPGWTSFIYNPCFGGDPREVLDAISKEFGVEIVFEQSYKRWNPECWNYWCEPTITPEEFWQH